MNIVFPNMPVTSGQLSNSLVDETGTGNIVLNTSPTLVTPVLTGTVSGSTAAGGTLTLTGTSSATKSATGISLGSVVTVDEVNGRVGVGTTTPLAKLHINYGNTLAPATETLRLEVTGNTGTDRGPILNLFAPNGSGTSKNSAAIGGVQSSVNGGGSLLLYTSNLGDGTTPTEKMRINNLGNVGIGTTAPAVSLDVVGLIKTSGYTVATLPAGVTGARAYVTDATSPTYNGSLTGGGTVVVPVFYNGSAWVSA